MEFSRQPDLDLSIVIVSHNAEKLLRKCLDSISRYQKELVFEVTVVDNCSEDQTTAMLKRDFPQVRLLENRTNPGFSAACNQGIRLASGRYVFLLNPDTEFTAGGITRMIGFMESHRQAAICGPRMVDPQGRVQFSCRSFPSYLTAFSSGQSILNRLFPANPLSRRYLLRDRDRTGESQVDWVSGSSLLTRREVFETIGLLDERFFMYAEDVDFCLRARQNGLLTYYFPQVTILHHIGQSTKRKRLSMQVEHHRSMYRFYCKHYASYPLLRGVVFLGVWIRLWFTIWAGFFVPRGR
jgi:GT2 family glycosyltransferase